MLPIKKHTHTHTLESAFISSIASTLNYSSKRFSEFYMFIWFSNLLEEILKIYFIFTLILERLAHKWDIGKQ